jgi:PAS domain S-box-containing protein
MSNLQRKYRANTWLLTRPWVAGLFTFALLSALCLYFIILRYNTLKKEEKQTAITMAETAAERLQLSLQYSLSATQALTLTIDKDGIPRYFDSIAAYILQNNKYIDALQLVPGGVIQYVYPLKGHEAVIGYDILKDSSRNKEALKAISKKELFFAGPFQLRQGGKGVVGRLPVFRNNRFWGFSAVVIKWPTLLKAAGIDTTGNNGYYFQLSKINPDSKKEEYFLPFKEGSYNRQDASITVPDGEWKLSVKPVNGYKTFKDVLPTTILALILSVVGGLFAAYLSRMPTRLQALVLEQTAELDKSEKRNKAIVNALPDMVFVLNNDGKFIDYNNAKDQHPLVPKEQFIGKKVQDIMPPGLASDIRVNLEKVFTTCQMLTHSYQLEMDNELRDYEARYIPQDKESVLILVRDMTEIKKAEKRIRDSEAKYRTLVEQASDGIFIANFQGKFLVVNPAGCKLSQYSEEELLNMRIHDLAVMSELQVMPFKFEEILAGKTAMSERKMRRKDGELIDVEISARIIAPDRFLAFARDISERKKAENELRKSREDLRLLSNYIENVREEERLNLSREIHDELGQQLTVLKMDISRLSKKVVDREDHDHIEKFDQVLGSINNMVETVREIAARLRPGLLDDLGLAATLEWYCNDFTKRTGIRTNFICGVTEDKFSQNINIGLFRIFQESLTNVVRHADATKIDVSLVRQEQQLILMIEDDGKGLDLDSINNRKTLGILGMKERAIMIGGSYNIYSTPGKGTIVEVAVPLAHHEEY